MPFAEERTGNNGSIQEHYMRAVIQRVAKSSVTVEEKVTRRDRQRSYGADWC